MKQELDNHDYKFISINFIWSKVYQKEKILTQAFFFLMTMKSTQNPQHHGHHPIFTATGTPIIKNL